MRPILLTGHERSLTQVIYNADGVRVLDSSPELAIACCSSRDAMLTLIDVLFDILHAGLDLLGVKGQS